MAYSDAIKKLKDALKGYSAEEEKLASLYKTAVEDAEKQHAASLERIEKQYSSDRNTAYSDTAREERNLFNRLSQRGLGSSGEAAQAKLNSNVVLANRLGALARSKNDSVLDLELGLSSTKTELLKEEAQKRGELGEKKNRLASDIAKIELDRETAANELKAKYDYLEASKNTSDKNGTSSGDKEEAPSDEAETVVGYVPEVSASELAKQLIKSAAYDERYITTETDRHRIDKYLLELKSIYNINEDYYNDLVFALEGYGYEAGDESDKRVSVITVDAEEYYNKRYNDYYDQFILFGMTDNSARLQADKTAKLRMLEYTYDRCKTVEEFRKCCLTVGIPPKEIGEFLESDYAKPKTNADKKEYTGRKPYKAGDVIHSNNSWDYR